jgi:tRNA1(Val) A37 N6-methylase TrmN6
MFRPDELTDDGFLGQRLRILQPRQGYRAATDPVLLAAAAVPLLRMG